MEKFICPCCNLKTLNEKSPGSFEICLNCFWEDDLIQFNDPNYEGGANSFSLNKSKENYKNFGICDPKLNKNK